MMSPNAEKVEDSKRDTLDQGDAYSSPVPTNSTPTATDAGKPTTSNMPGQEDVSRSTSPAPAETTSTATEAGNKTTTPGSESSGEAGLNNSTATPPSSTDDATVAASNDTASVTAPAAVPSSTADEPRRLDISTVTLEFDTIADALSDGLMGREPLIIPNDDVSRVKTPTNARSWVHKLMQAFGQDYLTEPEDASKKSPAQKLWWTRWQKQGHASVVAIFDAESKGLVHLEKSCWHLFDAVVKAHELGVITNPSANNNTLPSKLKCSARLEFIVGMLEKYALVRLDVLRSWHVDEIAANPEVFVKRKVTNCWNNGNRAAKLARKQGLDVETAGKLRGRKRAAAATGGDEEEQGAVEPPVKAKWARKSAAARNDDEETAEAPVKGKKARKSVAASGGESVADSDSKVKGKGKSGVKRTRTEGPDVTSDEPAASHSKLTSTAGVEDDEGEDAGSGAEGAQASDGKESTSDKRPSGSEASSVTGAQEDEGEDADYGDEAGSGAEAGSGSEG